VARWGILDILERTFLKDFFSSVTLWDQAFPLNYKGVHSLIGMALFGMDFQLELWQISENNFHF